MNGAMAIKDLPRCVIYKLMKAGVFSYFLMSGIWVVGREGALS